MLFYFRISGPNFQGVPIDQWRPFNQWKVLLVALGTMNRTRTIAVVPEIVILILFSDYMCLLFSFNCPTPNSRTIRRNTITQWIPLVKLDTTGQMLRPDVLGLYLGIETYPFTKSILKRHFMPETFISIDNNLQRRVRLHNIDRLSHDTVFWNLHFYMLNVISEEILGFFMIPVSVLYIFIATAYNILRFTAKNEIKL